MIVLPNSYERYLSSLRIFVSISILKHGLMRKHLKRLKKITIAEAFYNKSQQQSIDIKMLCNNLLGAVATIKSDFKFFVNVSGNYLINQKLFSCLLLTAAQNSNIKITSNGEYLLLLFFESGNTIYPLIKALGGLFLKEYKTSLALAVIPITPTTQESSHIHSEWEYLFDKFSIVNLFIGSEEL